MSKKSDGTLYTSPMFFVNGNSLKILKILKGKAALLLILQALHFLLPVCPEVLGATYAWDDASGTRHFTDNPDQIPPGVMPEIINQDNVQNIAPVYPRADKVDSPPVTIPVKVELYGGIPGNDWQQRFRQAAAELKYMEQNRLRLEGAMQSAHRRYVTSLDKKGAGSPLNLIGQRRQSYNEAKAQLAEMEALLAASRGKLDNLRSEADAVNLPDIYRIIE